MNLWLREACDKIKVLYHHYHNVFGYQTWQIDYLPWGAPSTQNYLTFWSRDRARSNNKLKALYLHSQSAYDHQAWEDDNLHLRNLYQWNHRMLRLSGLARSCNKLTPFHLQYQSLWLSNLAGWWLILRGSHPKFTEPFGHVVLQDYVTK